MNMTVDNEDQNSDIYMDYNATSPLDSEVHKIICDVLKNNWANPSSSYRIGVEAKNVVKTARNHVAKMINAIPGDILFTSGGTEANHMVIHSVIQNYKDTMIKLGNSNRSTPHVITSNIEHDSVILPLKRLHDEGTIELAIVPVCKKEGRVKIDDIKMQIKDSTCFITVMLANNETGIIQPISSLRSCVEDLNKLKLKEGLHPITLHTDAAQAIGKINVDIHELDVDFLTIVGHKFYGPRIGALFAKNMKSSPLKPFFLGGGQENGYRSGTENTGMIAGLGKAAELVFRNIELYQSTMQDLRNYLESQLEKKFMEKVHFLGKRSGIQRIPNTCSVAFTGLSLNDSSILKECKKVVASVGAACHSESSHASSVLLSSGVPECIAKSAIRLSVGRETTKQDIDAAVEDLHRAYKILSKENILN